MPLLESRKLTKIYKTQIDEVIIFKDLDLSIESSEAIAIVGQSGRGKTTLLNLLSGLDHPSGGEVYFKGSRFDQLNEDTLSDFRNQNTGFIFQHHYLLEDFTAIENVLIPLRIRGIKIHKSDIEHAENILESFGMKERLHHFPDQLSGGERQRVAIARAIVHNPEIIFADEPTGSLDRKNSTIIEDMLWKIKNDFKKTLIVATHNLEIAGKCDRIINLG